MMIEFVSDPQAPLRDMCALLAPGGRLSLLDTNRYSDTPLQALLFHNLEAAGKALGATTYFHPWVNRLAPRFDAQQFIDALPAHGCTLAGHYGIQSLCSYLSNDFTHDPQNFAALEALEHCMTDVYPYYLLARIFQIIARKSEPQPSRV
jgi:SAM-dependent methyltransferase